MLNPSDEAELAEAVAGAKGPLRITGGGTRPLGQPVEGDQLNTAGLAGITLYDPAALTIMARAGTPVADIQAVLAAEGQCLPFEPMDHRPLFGTKGRPTIGGVVAANVSGPRRIQAGACRDSLIGVRFVDGQGTIVKNGGRVMKNVTGYDLVKLMAGSYGTLGVLSEVSFKVLPMPERSATVRIEGLDPNTAVTAMSAALGSPFEVTGAAHLTAETGGPATLLRLEGPEAQVRGRTEKLSGLLARFGDAEVQWDEAAGWAAIRDATPVGDADGDVWRISVKPSDGAGVLARLPEGARGYLDWGGGLVWAAVMPGTDLRAKLDGLKGHATLLRAAPETRTALGVFHPESAPLAAIAGGLRQKYDPRGILNPGLMG